jgi:ABC-type polysaccharide/polyol phosphate export permease
MTAQNGQLEPSARRELIVELLLDAAIAAACYLLAYRVRFAGPRLQNFLPYALTTLPIVVATQITTLVALRVYTADVTWNVMRRLLPGTLIGTGVAAALVWQIHGLTGVSRAAFSADWLLFTSAVAGWRTGRALWRQQTAPSVSPPAMIDRAAERPTLGGTIVSLVHHRELIKNLVLKDLKLKYRGSVLGFIWSLLSPLVMITVYTLAFTYVIRTAVPGFVYFLLLGLLAWNFFAGAAIMSTGAIIDSGSLMKSVAFPRAILPIATVIFGLTQYVLTAIVFLPLMLIVYGIVPSGPMLLYPVFLSLQVLFTIGVALMLAAGTAFFRDIKHLLDIGLAALFWMTPILYPLTQVHEKLRLFILLSPMSPFIVAYQQIFFYRQWPALTVWVVGLAYSLGAFLLGAWLFLSLEDQLAEQL